MDPDQKLVDVNSASDEKQIIDPAKNDKYAVALAQMATLDYNMSQARQPKTKHFISKKFIVWTVASALLIIIPWAYSQIASRNDSEAKAKDSQRTQQLLNSAQELQDLQNQ